MSEDHSNSSPILQHNNNFQTPSPNITSVIWAIFHAGTGTWASLGSTVWGPNLSHGTLHNWCGVVLFKNKIRFPMKVFSGKEHCGLPTKSPQRDSKGKIALGLTWAISHEVYIFCGNVCWKLLHGCCCTVVANGNPPMHFLTYYPLQILINFHVRVYLFFFFTCTLHS